MRLLGTAPNGCRIIVSEDYHLWVTDPRVERTLLAKPDGVYELGECYLTISLGEPFNGNCSKLIAAIIRSGEKGDE